jgi:hypothetical protein
MRPPRPISAIRPIARLRRFGLIDPGWPAHRAGPRGATPGLAVPAVPRRFRRPDVPGARRAAAAPVNLAVTNLTLCPRLELRLAAYTRAVKEVSIHVRNVTLRAETQLAIDKVGRSGASGRSAAERVIRVNETVLEKITRVFLSRPATATAAPARHPGGVPGRAPAPTIRNPAKYKSVPAVPRVGRVPGLPQVVETIARPPQPHRSADAMRRKTRHLRINARFPDSQTSVVEVTAERLDRVARTHVLRRILRLDHRQLNGTEEESIPIRTSLPQGARRVAGAMELDFAGLKTGAAPQGPVSSAPARPPDPAPRIFRAEPQPSAPVPAPVSAPQTVYQAPPPQIDMGRLDRELWQRFEKRMRIEHERRGRS